MLSEGTLKFFDAYIRSVCAEDHLVALGDYLKGQKGTSFERRLRMGITNDQLRGPLGAVISVLLDNTNPDYTSLLGQCRTYQSMPSVLNGGQEIDSVVKFLENPYRPTDKGQLIILRMALINDQSNLIAALEERGHTNQRARELYGRGTVLLNQLL